MAHWVPSFGPMHIGMFGEGGWGAAAWPMWFQRTVWYAQLATIAFLFTFLGTVGARSILVKEPAAIDWRFVIFGSFASVILIAPFTFGGYSFERYLIPVIPFFLLAILSLTSADTTSSAATTRTRRIEGLVGRISGLIVMALIGSVSISYAHDSLLWNRLRWQAVGYLIGERKVSPERIDGGWTVNGWYLFVNDAELRERFARWRTETEILPWFKNTKADYAISFDTVDEEGHAENTDRNVIWVKPYSAWLPHADGAVIVEQLTGGGSRHERHP